MINLGVNIDHIATLRNARGDFFPSLSVAAGIAEQNGADFITIHLREDRRHIRDHDVNELNNSITTYLNLEMACNKDVLEKALKVRPYKVTLVPERREEVTTEGGLNVRDNFDKIKEYTDELQNNGTIVSLFIEPDLAMIDKFAATNVKEIEIHTGKYSLALPGEQQKLLKEIQDFSSAAKQAGLKVCAGHGLTYHNVQPLCFINEIEELNIGYSIITRAVFSGLGKAVSQMRELIREAELLCSE